MRSGTGRLNKFGAGTNSVEHIVVAVRERRTLHLWQARCSSGEKGCFGSYAEFCWALADRESCSLSLRGFAAGCRQLHGRSFGCAIVLVETLKWLVCLIVVDCRYYLLKNRCIRHNDRQHSASIIGYKDCPLKLRGIFYVIEANAVCALVRWNWLFYHTKLLIIMPRTIVVEEASGWSWIPMYQQGKASSYTILHVESVKLN